MWLLLFLCSSGRKTSTVREGGAVLWGVGLLLIDVPSPPQPPPTAQCGLDPFCPELLGYVIGSRFQASQLKQVPAVSARAQHPHGWTPECVPRPPKEARKRCQVRLWGDGSSGRAFRDRPLSKPLFLSCHLVTFVLA